jgi:hypothetical protein
MFPLRPNSRMALEPGLGMPSISAGGLKQELLKHLERASVFVFQEEEPP